MRTIKDDDMDDADGEEGCLYHCVLGPSIWIGGFGKFWIYFSKYYQPLGSWSALQFVPDKYVKMMIMTKKNVNTRKYINMIIMDDEEGC